MTKKITVLGIVLLGLVLVAAVVFRPSPQPTEVATGADADPSMRRGALVDQVVITQEPDAGKVAGLIETGSHHVFAQGLSSTTIFHRLRDSERAEYDLSYGLSMELTLNPVGPTFKNGDLNPFHKREIREALNWLINRRHVAEEIYGGLAVPRYLPLNTAFPDYARLADVARALEVKYRHDPEMAEQVISREMEALGANRVGGRWSYKGRPVRVSVLIRAGDERTRVGDYVAGLLDGLGFQVERNYRTTEEASRIWYAGDPAAGQWHVYTGAWVSVIIQRDLSGNFSFYYTPRGQPAPLWQAYTPTPEFSEIASRLDRGDYTTWNERQGLMAKALELSMQDSARVWVVDQLNISPRSADVSLASDLAGGISGSLLWPYTLRFADRVGGNVVIATTAVLMEPWNLIAGSNFSSDRFVMRALDDSEVLPDPYTGLFWPQRIDSAAVSVEKGVPVTVTHDWLSLDVVPEIHVPKDAWIDWDPKARKFISVGEKHPEGIRARTRTVIRYEAGYLNRRWHDGTQVSLADMVLPYILNFERATEESRLFDASHVPAFDVFKRQFRGMRITSREPLAVEVYSDQLYPDAEFIVAAQTAGAAPWHTLALGIQAENAGELTFSSNKADRLQVTWMSLVTGPSLPVLDRHLQISREEKFLPFAETLAEFVRPGEIEQRYRAITDWRAQRGHYWVGTGPFYLHSVHPTERTIVLRRYLDFPDSADKWLRFAAPEIPTLELDGPFLVEAGQDAEFTLRVAHDGKPYPKEGIESVDYLLFDSAGELVRKGGAERAGNGAWAIRLPSQELAPLGTGANSLEAVVVSNRVALPAFASYIFATVPAKRAAESAQ